jgi:hypothetical protein
VTIARHTRWQVILRHIKQSDIVKFNSFSHTVIRLENQKQRITAMNFIALKSQGRKENALCHFDPFGQAQGKLREKSFLDPSHSLGMTGLSPSLGVLCVFARVFVFPFSQTTFQPIIVNPFGCLYAASCREFDP